MLEAICISDISLTSSSSSISKQTEDAILDIVRVVELQVGIAEIDDVLMRMLLRDFTATKHALGEGRRIGHWSGAGEADEGCKESSGFVLHVY